MFSTDYCFCAETVNVFLFTLRAPSLVFVHTRFFFVCLRAVVGATGGFNNKYTVHIYIFIIPHNNFSIVAKRSSKSLIRFCCSFMASLCKAQTRS